MNWFSNIINKIRFFRRKVKRLEELVPPVADLIAQAKAKGAMALGRILQRSGVITGAIRVGDFISAIEPKMTQLEVLDWVMMAARALGVSGPEKLNQVEQYMRAAWPLIVEKDEDFDWWWATEGRDYLEARRTEAKRRGAW